MNTFMTADLHLNHSNILKYTKRPWTTVEDMSEALIENWNNTVKPNDRVFHLGDFCWGNKFADAYPFLIRLNGEKWFVPGNHDKPILDLPKYDVEAHYLKAKMMIMPALIEIKIDGIPITLCHYAMRTWNKSHYGTYQLHGHSHGQLPDDPNLMQMDVGVDCHPEYRPFSFDEIKEYMNKKTFKPIER